MRFRLFAPRVPGESSNLEANRHDVLGKSAALFTFSIFYPQRRKWRCTSSTRRPPDDTEPVLHGSDRRLGPTLADRGGEVELHGAQAAARLTTRVERVAGLSESADRVERDRADCHPRSCAGQRVMERTQKQVSRRTGAAH